ncbi:MAG TPA: hypothetical protein VGP87_11755 [Gemmatimonadales bacterium]|jgi:hypothetical protein|nr:hypothetical protein [Gemmatimonadales bacterium]
MSDPRGGAENDDPVVPEKRELLEAFDGVVSREREKVLERRSLPVARRTHAAVIVVCVLSWGALAYTWLARPAWLFPPDPATRLTPSQRESRLRFGMYLERERVLDFWATHKRLPRSLEEVGDVEAGIDYAVRGDSTFVVSALVRDSVLTLDESQSADELLRPAGLKPSRAR